MASTEVEICNLALHRIGQSAIVSLTEDSEEAVYCSAFYEGNRQAVLRDHAWNFAENIATLTATSGEPNDYTYEYAPPDDNLRILEIVNIYSSVKLEYRMRARAGARYIYTDQGDEDEQIDVKYIMDEDDVTIFDPVFTEALSYRLASDLAMAIANRLDMADAMMRKYEGVLYKAKGLDASESKEPKDTFISVRS